MLILDNKKEIELQATIKVTNLLHSIVDTEQVIKIVYIAYEIYVDIQQNNLYW